MSETTTSAQQTTPWGAGAPDWAEVMEGPKGWGIPVYERILDRVKVDGSTGLLDVGCGAGRFCRMARDRGAQVSGLDATPELIAIARERVPDARFEVGDMQELPWPDDSFDVVTGFNSFFLADDMVAALREARRVSRPGGALALSIFGRPERCDSTEIFAALGRLVEGDSPDADQPEPSGPALHEEDVITGIARKAGLEPTEVGYLRFEEQYPDIATMARGFLAAPPGRRAVAAAGEDAARAALSEAAKSSTDDSGAVQLREEVRYLVATT